MLGRLAPGMTRAAAQDEMSGVAADLERTYPENRARGVHVVAWTVNEPRDLVRLDGVGVNAVVVNNPAMFVSTLAA